MTVFLLRGCHTECCVMMRSEKALNPVQTWLPSFSAIHHYTTFGMASLRRAPDTFVQYGLSNLFGAFFQGS